MVRLGFIVEGETEKIILEQSDFFDFLREHNIAFIKDVINANGNGNLLPHNISKHAQILSAKGATHIFVLTDQDQDKCVTLTKQRVAALPDHYVIIAVKQVEAWFLADSVAMQQYLSVDEFYFDDPELEVDPFKTIGALRMRHRQRGIPSKITLAKTLIQTFGFSIKNAAKHPNCHSIHYFIRQLFAVRQ